MNRVRVAFRSVGVSFAVPALALFAFAGPATAVAPQRTFVASFGVDAGNLTCSLANPCRTFNVAIGVVNAGGEVVILDTAGYGPFTINKSIKVIGPSGVYGGISVQGGAGATTGIVINAGNSDDITLRGLDITGVPGAVGPFPDIGIDIQNAGGVHIEKSSIGNFNQGTSSCINFSTANTVRVYVVDSFLRECRTGISANGTAVPCQQASLIVDNTRIERGRGPVVSYGLWAQGIHRRLPAQQHDFAAGRGHPIRKPLAAISHVELLNSELTRNTTAIQVTNTTANAGPQVSIIGSQILGVHGRHQGSNNATPANVTLSVMDSEIGYTAAGGIRIVEPGADLNGRIFMEFVRFSIHNITANGVDLSATNGSKTYFDARDSTFSMPRAWSRLPAPRGSP